MGCDLHPGLRASVVSARRMTAMPKWGVSVCVRFTEVEKSHKSARRARILGYSRMEKVLESMQKVFIYKMED